MSAGLDHIDLEAAWRRGVTVTNTPVLSDAVADLTVALMTMLSRRLPQAMRAVAERGNQRGRGEQHVQHDDGLARQALAIELFLLQQDVDLGHFNDDGQAVRHRVARR